jgi:lipopolysaccharide export system protein LptA
MAAATVVLIVAGVYVQRSILRGRARRGAPAMVPATVQQQSANFSYSDVEQGRTVFTIRASHATQFKDQDRALLKDVRISVYGHEGNRNDNIHARECSYQPLNGGILCEGDVAIDIHGANPAAAKPADEPLQVKTRDLAFNRQTGEASTAAPVDFSFPQGTGHGVGISYSTEDSTVRVEHSVEFHLSASDRAGGLAANASGSSLEIHRNERVIVLNGPALVRQGARELSAGKILIDLDKDNRVQKLLAEDHPSIRGAEGGAKFSMSANTFEAPFNQQGGIENIVANGSVAGMRQAAGGADRFSASHIEMAMQPERNLIRQMTATGGVTAQSQQGADSRVLKTEALKVVFSAAERASGSTAHASEKSQPASLLPSAGQRIESAETLAPATIESKTGDETTELGAKKFVAQFNGEGRLDKLLGHSDVRVRREVANGVPQVISAAELVATFGPDGQWDSLDESGNVRFQQADRQASAARAEMNRSSGAIALEGSPVLTDSMSRTTAGEVNINQQSGEIRASGGVVSTYLAAANASSAVNLGSGPAHISADGLSGSSTSGQVLYSGHARLWQGESVLDSDQIEIWRDDKKLQASGHVVAIFPQAPGSGPSFAAMPGAKTNTPAPPAGPTLWQVHAPLLTYWGDQGKAHLEGGVTASSQQGSLQSRSLDVFLESGKGASGGSSSDSPGRTSIPAAPGSQQLSRVLAQGDVIVRQGDRRGTGEQAEYTAADQKFVLSGGHPTLTDASSDTTTGGRSLTFFVASDTILIDSEEGLRTLTKHRVEK